MLGTGLCLSIVWCNLAVSRALSRLSRKAGVLRRVTRSSSRAKPLLTMTGPAPEIVTTAEERAFARLMAVLSISFVVCWMPQMVSDRSMEVIDWINSSQPEHLRQLNDARVFLAKLIRIREMRHLQSIRFRIVSINTFVR